MTKQIGFLIGMITSVCTAVVGQAELIGEPWRHYVTIGAIVGTAITGYLLQKPSPWDGNDRRKD